jgi:hypothetical protein
MLSDPSSRRRNHGLMGRFVTRRPDPCAGLSSYCLPSSFRPRCGLPTRTSRPSTRSSSCGARPPWRFRLMARASPTRSARPTGTTTPSRPRSSSRPPTAAPPVQLTRAKKSSSAPAWSPDGRWIAFVSDRTDKRQLYLIAPDGGEARPLTDVEGGVGSFAWSPDGSRIAMTMTDPASDAAKERDERYGAFEIVDEEYRMTHLHVIDVDPAGLRAGEAEAIDQWRLHRRQLQLVARQRVDRVRSPRRSERQQLPHCRHLGADRRGRGDPKARHAARAGLAAGLVAGRTPDRLPERHAERVVLLLE